jgi:hypothetical protein
VLLIRRTFPSAQRTFFEIAIPSAGTCHFIPSSEVA